MGSIWPREGAHIYTDNPDYLLLRTEDVMCIIWRRNTQVEGVADLERHLRADSGSRGRKLGLVSVVQQSAALPEPEARTALTNSVARSVDVVQANALIVEGEGFKAATVRAVTSGMLRLANHPFPVRCFSELAEGLLWLKQEMAQRPGGKSGFDLPRIAALISDARGKED